MFQKVLEYAGEYLEYAGEYRKTTYLSMVVMLIGIVMNVLPFLFIYQLIRPLLLGESLELGYAAWRVAAIAVCGILYAVLYVKGLSLSHRAAYNTLKNLRASLQGKLERQPLGVIQEKGVGALKKMFIDDIDRCSLTTSTLSSCCWPMPCRRGWPIWRCLPSSFSPCFSWTGSWHCSLYVLCRWVWWL